MNTTPVVLTVQVFAAPAVACCGGSTWEGATQYLRERLRQRFGESVSVEFIEMFAPRSFEFPDVLRALEAGGTLPMVRVGNEIVSQGAKLSEARIAEAVTRCLRDAEKQEKN